MIDKGIGEEVARVQAIISELAAHGTVAVEVTADGYRAPERLPRGQLLLCQAGLGPLTALVAASDLYIGYDSGFQHIAAALSVPVVDVFVSAPNELFFRRWRPHSRAPVDVIQAGTSEDGRDVHPARADRLPRQPRRRAREESRLPVGRRSAGALRSLAECMCDFEGTATKDEPTLPLEMSGTSQVVP